MVGVDPPAVEQTWLGAPSAQRPLCTRRKLTAIASDPSTAGGCGKQYFDILGDFLHNDTKNIKLKQTIFPSFTKPDLTTCLGIQDIKIKSPICITSTAFQKMAHPQGEIATA